MTALTKNINRTSKDGKMFALPVKADAHIFHDALVKVGADGFLAPCAAEAGAAFAGRALEEVDAAGLSNGEALCRVDTKEAMEIEGAAFVAADLYKKVYASDDNTVSVIQAANEQLVGVIVEVISATKVMVLPLIQGK